MLITFQRERATYSASIARARSSETREYDASPEALLTGRELDYFARLQFERRRVSFLLGRLAAKRAISEYAGVQKLTSIEIAIGVFGQPIVSFDRAGCVEVSITHCGDCAVAAAFSPEHPVGIDLEAADELVRAARDYAGPDELNAVEGLKWGDAFELAVIWSAKEALSKVLKCGLTSPMEVLAISAVESASPKSAVIRFKNFSQYKCHTTCLQNHVFSIVLPGRSILAADNDSLSTALEECGRQPER